jgi:hypothetical protein
MKHDDHRVLTSVNWPIDDTEDPPITQLIIEGTSTHLMIITWSKSFLSINIQKLSLVNLIEPGAIDV